MQHRAATSSFLCLMAGALLLGTPSLASGGFITFQNRADFSGATPGLALVDFEDFGVSAAFNDPSAVAFPAGPFGPASITRQGATLSSYGVTGGYLSATGPVVTDTRSAVNVLGPNYLGYT